MKHRSLALVLALSLILMESACRADSSGSAPTAAQTLVPAVQAASLSTSVESEEVTGAAPVAEAAATPVLEALPSFSDVPKDAPWHDAVCYAAHLGVLEGVGGGRFRPDQLVSRATVCVVLWRMAGSPISQTSVSYPDIPTDAWYLEAAYWATEAGIVTGDTQGRFLPDKNVIREQLAAMLYRFAAYRGFPTDCTGTLAGCRDAGQVTPYAVTPLSWAIGRRLYAGMVYHTIHPSIAVSRAQLAQTLVGLAACGEGDPAAAEIVAGYTCGQVLSASRNNHAQGQAAVDAAARKYGAVGVQVAVLERGEVTDTYQYGWATKPTRQYAVVTDSGEKLHYDNGVPITADHKLRVASISKVVLGMAAQRLREEGTVNLDAGIGTYWGLDLHNPSYPNTPVTCSNILTHTSSIALLDSLPRHDSAAAKLSSRSGYGGGRPGAVSSWGYNNYAFGVLGMTLELAAGDVMDHILDRCFLDAMDIDAAFESGSVERTDLLMTIYQGGSVSRSVSAQKQFICGAVPGATGQFFAGGYTSSAKDLARLLSILPNDGVYEGLRLLSAESVERMERRIGTVPGGFQQAYPLRYQTNLYGRPALYYHTGSAYGVYNCVSYDPSTGDGVVVLTTGASGTKDSRGIYAVCGEISSALYSIIQETGGGV